MGKGGNGEELGNIPEITGGPGRCEEEGFVEGAGGEFVEVTEEEISVGEPSPGRKKPVI